MDNIQVVCLAYNLGKSEWSDDDMLVLAQAIVNKSQSSELPIDQQATQHATMPTPGIALAS